MKTARTFREKLKQGRMSCTDMWDALVDLAENLEGDLPLSEPLPPPDSLEIASRRTRSESKPTQVRYTAQLVPVVTSLVEVIIATDEAKKLMDFSSKEKDKIAAHVRAAKQRIKKAHEESASKVDSNV
jgi:hypothetical protein